MTEEHARMERLVRMRELFRPIEQQILMTDNKEDVMLLASIMLSTSVHMLVENIGPERTKQIVQELSYGAKNGTSSQKPPPKRT